MKKLKNIESKMNWSWIIIVMFFILSFIDTRFGILGFLCMLAPITHAIKGDGKVHCVKYCPRGSFLGKFFKKINLGLEMPKWMKSKKFKNILLLLMIGLLSFSIYHSNGNFNKLSFALFRFMGLSFIVGILMAILFKPRSWCIICPMGQATSKIQTIQVNLEQRKQKPEFLDN